MGHFISYDPFRFCLELFHRALFKQQPIISPSLEIGIGDGFSSWFMHRNKPNIDYGADMPLGATLESQGMGVPLRFDHFNRMIGMDMADIPFADNSFATIFSSHTMFYGQDLPATFREIMRVLAPGGTCAYFVDIDEWYQYKPLIDWLSSPGMNPTVKFFPKDYYLKILEDCGAANIHCRTFFQSAVEAILQGFYISMSTLPNIHGFLSHHMAHNPNAINIFDIMSEIFVTFIEKELALSNGPQEAFNICVSFQKPGTLPVDLSIPEPVCLACRNQDLQKNPISLTCSTCGLVYSVRAGIPMMIRENHPGYAPTALRQHAEQLFGSTDQLVHQLLQNIDKGPLYVVNEGQSPIGGYAASNILLAALNYQNRTLSGIYDPSISEETHWRGIPVVQAAQIISKPFSLLVFAQFNEHATIIHKLQQARIKGLLWLILWENTNGQLNGSLASVNL